MQWCVVGMPTCKYHGSGGKKNKELGFLRYLCWVITGGPQNMPVEAACRVALTVFAEAGRPTWTTTRGRARLRRRCRLPR